MVKKNNTILRPLLAKWLDNKEPLLDMRSTFIILLVLVAIVSFIYVNFVQLAYKSSANMACPFPASPDKVHGQVVLTPTDSESIYDCSGIDVIIANDGEVIVESYVNGDNAITGDYGVEIIFKNLTIEPGGKFNADGKGYTPAQADGSLANANASTDNVGGSGGGYGGSGGEGVDDGIGTIGTPGSFYGSAQNPAGLGGAGSASGNGGLGGNGGGAIKLTVNELLTIDGIISANGMSGQTSSNGLSSGGGGAGGSIWIEADSFAGSGQLYAQGAGASAAVFQGGGGGGGRIQMLCTTSSSFSGVTNVNGGNTSKSQNGGTGSVVGPTCRPSTPSILKQFKLNQTTEIAVGSATAESEFYLAANLVDPDINNLLYLEVEIKPLGTAFSNQPNYSQSSGYANPQNCSGGASTCGRINITGLTRATQYHWQARVRDNFGGYSNWVSFGGNNEVDSDILLSGQATSIALLSGDNQSAIVNTNLGEALTVKVTDAGGFPVPGFTVSWIVYSGANGGSLLDGTYTETNLNGEASNTYRVGRQAGLNNNIIRVVGYGLSGSPISFTASGNPDVINYFTLTVPDVSLVGGNFELLIKGYDQFNNLKTDLNGSVELIAVDPLDTSTIKTGTLTPGEVVFNGSEGGQQAISLDYNTAESIKIKASLGAAIGYSNTIAVVTTLGSCPDVDGIIDTNQTWAATPANSGIFDCSGMTIRVMSNATLTLQSYDSGDTDYNNDFGVTVLANELIVDNGSTVTASETGYSASRGPGAGGSYGGNGGLDNPYGDYARPFQLGSGGNYVYNVYINPAGGAIKLVLDNIVINGTLSSNGGAANIAGASATGSGSSGGSIYIITESIAGNGLIQSNGGASNGGSYFGRGGSGGRIAIYYTNSSFPLESKTNLQAFGGYGPYDKYGGPGTIFIDDVDDTNLSGSLYVNNNGINGSNAAVMGVGPYSLDLISVKEYGHLTFVDINSVVDITSGGENAITGDGTSVVTVNGLIKLPYDFALKKYRLNIAGDYEGAQNLTIGEITGNPVAQLSLNAHTVKRHGLGKFNDYQFTNLTIETTGLLSLQGYDGDSSTSSDNDANGRDDYGIILDIDNLLEIKNGGQVEADKRGYSFAKGPGGEGSYGGYGHSGTPYGNLYNPEDLGSAGGANGTAATENAGGAIKINTTHLINNGTISANGGATWATGGWAYGSGSSGGSIWINTVSINGAGLIRANGGDASGGHNFGRGGGGGRIAIYYDEGDYEITNKNRVQAFGGYGSNVGYAGAGTIFIDNRTDALTKGSLYINNNGHNGREAGVPGTGPYEFDLISIKEYGHLKFFDSNVIVDISTGGEDAVSADGTASLSVAGLIKLPLTFTIKRYTLDVIGDYEGASNLTIGESSGLTGKMTLYAYTAKRRGLGRFNNYQFQNLNVQTTGQLTLASYDGNNSNSFDNDPFGRDDYGIILNVDNLDIATGGLIDASNTGYETGAGPGGEGSYGGYAQSGNPYGDIYEPIALGTAGGANGSGYAYPAGGAIKIVASSINNSGTISSNGGNCVYVGASAYCSGSSGGSIWIDTVSLNGTGSIRANGGDAPGGHYFGWGGSGGRIAVYYNSGDFNVNTKDGIQAFGGYGANVGYAGAGTIFVDNKTDSLTKGTLYINNNAHNGKEAGISGVGPYEFDLISIKEYGHLKFIDADVIVDISTGGEEAVSADGTASLSVAGLIKLPETFAIRKFILDVTGDYEGASNLTVGEESGVAGSLKLYAYTSKRRSNNRYNNYIFENLNINSTGKITLTSYDGDSGNFLDNDSVGRDDYGVILEADNINIATNGQIEANNTGYATGAGPGGEGSYGGFGQSGNPYGNVYEPIELGTAGGRNISGYAYPAGGAIKILTASLSNNGIISSNGGDCIYLGNSASCSGSSGGSIWIDTDILNGNGSIRANGGTAPVGHYFGWGGSGGRIAIYYSSGDYDVTSKDQIQAFGGYGGNTGFAGAGTIFVDNKSDSLTKGTLFVNNNNNHNGKEAGVSGFGPYEFDLISIKEYGHLKFIDADVIVDISTGGEEAVSADGTASLSVAGLIKLPEIFSIKKFTLDVTGDYEGATNLSVGEGSGLPGSLKLYAYTAKRNSVGKKNIYQFENLTVNETGTIRLVSYNGNEADANDDDEDGRDDYGVYLDIASFFDIKAGGLVESNNNGYATGAGPGGEGSYGGYGQSGSPYGNYTQPLDFGSAGGSNGSGYAYPAGGVIKISAQTLRNNGTVSANGGNCIYVGASAYCSGSSGGSILIETNLLEGNGLISTNGGNAPGGHYFGRGGSGGRIAIYYNETTFDVSSKIHVQSFGGYGPNVGYAGPGSIYYKNNLEEFGSLIFENNNNPGRAENLVATDYLLRNLFIGNNVITYALGDTENNRGTIFRLSGDFYLGSGAEINGVGYGFPSDEGPGAGEIGPNPLSGGGGGANGGSGGTGQSNDSNQAQGGQPYNTENQMQPLMLGSGGGSSGAGAKGGSGGGAIAIDARFGNIDLFGTINVNGTDGKISSPGGGGGAGGSILLIGSSCDITGNLFAEGGDGGNNNYDGGGGGGGRASILVTSPLVNCDTSTATVSVAQGYSSEGIEGQVGTYVGVASLPQIELQDQSRLSGESIPVGGVISVNQVELSASILDPAATEINEKNLVADFELVKTTEDFGLVSNIYSTQPNAVSSSEPLEVSVQITSDIEIGASYKWRARVRDVALGTTSSWQEFGANGDAADFRVLDIAGFEITTETTNVETEQLIDLEVRALTSTNDTAVEYMGTVLFSYSPTVNPGPNLPSNYHYTEVDQGIKEFSELMFFLPGTYTIYVVDSINSAITGSIEFVVTQAPTPVVTSPVVTTPIVSIITPSVTTDNVVVTTTISPTESNMQTCAENPLQARCQVNVEIFNVVVKVNDEQKSAEICWETNIPTIGNVTYGKELLNEDSGMSTIYNTMQCVLLEGLAADTAYNFNIRAISQVGREASEAGTFKLGKADEPTQPMNCIVVSNYSFDAEAKLILNYNTISLATCDVSYSQLGDTEPIYKDIGTKSLINHISLLELSKIAKNRDIGYDIHCVLNSAQETEVNTCDFSGAVPRGKLGVYLPETGNDSELMPVLDNVLDTTSRLMPVVAIPVLIATVSSLAVANPHVFFYGIFWFKRSKKKSAWGIVYDEVSSKPVPFAVLRLFNVGGTKLLKEEVSSIEGKYNFIVNKGLYKLTIEHSDYLKVEKEINISTNGDTIAHEIKLKRLTAGKQEVSQSIKSRLINFFNKNNEYIVLCGLLITIIATILSPVLINFIVLGLYLLQELLILRTKLIRWGKVIDASNNPLNNAFVRLYDPVQQRQLEVTLTDASGSYKFNNNDGRYLASVHLDGYTMADSPAKVSSAGSDFTWINIKGGVTQNNIKLVKKA